MPFFGTDPASGRDGGVRCRKVSHEIGPDPSLDSATEQRRVEVDQVWSREGPLNNYLKGLILAQNERWRRGLGMQVGGIPQGGTGVRGSKAWVPTRGFGIAIRDGG